MVPDKLRAYAKTFARTRYRGLPDLLRLPVKRPAILVAVGTYEGALLVGGRVDARLKMLAAIKTGSLVGCRF